MIDARPSQAKSEVATPSNAITLLRILLVPVFVAALLTPWPEWLGLPLDISDDWKSIVAAAIFVIISGTDWLDGYLARSRNEVTDFGKFMDPLADKILVAAALICLVELGDLPTWVVLIILAREFIVSGVRMMAASKGIVIAASMVGKFKTVFQMIAIVLFTVKRSHVVTGLGDAFGDLLWVISWLIMLVALALTIASMVDYLVKSREVIGLGKSAFDSSVNDGFETEGDIRALATQRSREAVSLAKGHSRTISTAESLTGGMIGAALTSVPGSSSIFLGGIISYTDAIKGALLHVSQDTLAQHGAVSAPVAIEMAHGARVSLGTSIALSATGLAGPDADDRGNPVGTVFIGLSTEAGETAFEKHFQGDRSAIRLKCVAFALEVAIEELKSPGIFFQS